MGNKIWDFQNGISTRRNKSNAIWFDCPEEALRWLYQPGTVMHEDFLTYQADMSGWDTLTDSGSVAGADISTGGLALTTAASSNSYAYAIFGNGKTGMVSLANGGRAWFEARVKVSAITSCAVNIGLALAGTNTFQAAGAIVDTTGASATSNGSYIMFRTVAASPSVLDAVYATDGTAASTLQAGSTGLYRADGTTRLQAITADTYVKVGFRFDGTMLWAYVDGKLVKEDPVRYTATNLPDGVTLTPYFGIKAFSSAARTLTVDWVAAACQEP